MTFPVLTHYRILEKLGQGGMGEVFLALDTRLNRKVALKFLSQHLRDDPSARKRLLREAQAAATLDHPFICKVYEVAEDQGQVFIAMEFVEGDTLQQRLAAGPLPLKDVLGVATEIAEALEVAHSHSIVHRDLKPANIMLGRGGHIKVMDFGLAKQVKPVAAVDDVTATVSLLTEAGMVVGTLDYASPEQLRGGEDVDVRSDIFSFGAILCETISGRNPLRKSSPMETVSATLSGAAVSLPQLEAAPSFLSHIVRKMLEKNSDDRYQSVKDLMADLRLVRADSVSGPGRRLAAIMFTDMVSYSAIAGRDEALAMQLLHEHRQLLRPVFARYNGQEIKTVGDAFLVEFMSAVQATECAVDIQKRLFERNASAEPNRRIRVRIGLHLGDVIHEQNDVFGDGVNIASRIQPFAEPGGICLSEDVANQIRNKVPFPLVPLAEGPQLKGIDRPVRILRVALPWDVQPPTAAETAVPAVAQAAAAPGAASERGTALQRLVPHSRALAWSAVSILTVVAVAAVVVWISSRKPILSFAPREWVLIGDFENQTGEAVFDQSLETALTVSMQQSQYANVLPRSRITTALRRMKKPADQRIDEPVGTEICQREKIRGLIVPSISKVGQKYALAARIVDPNTGDTVRSYMEPAADQDQILSRLDGLAASIRRDLGESLASVQQSSKELRMVTTPSLEALKLFSDGVARWSKGDYKTAVQLYESAVKIDPDFAKAHAALGVCYCSFVFNDRIKGKEHLDKALRLSDRVTERERQQIQIQHEDNLGSKENVLGLYRVYLQAYPDDTGYRYNYANVLRDEGQTQDAAAQYQEVLRLDMNSASAHINLAVCDRTLKKYPEALASYTRAFELEPTWMTQGNLNHEYGFTLVLSGNAQAARDVFTKAMQTSRPGALRSLAMLDLYQGKYGSAATELGEALLENVAAKSGLSEARNHLYLSMVFEGQRKDAARLVELDKATKNLETPPPQVWLASRVGVSYARRGALAKARALLERIHKDAEMQIAQQSSDVHRLEGELELAQGDRSGGIEKLLLADREKQSPLTIESLARAYRVTGDNGAAIAQYEQLVSQDEGSVGWEPQQEWLMSHFVLAKLYESVGQKDKAKSLVDRLLQLWKDADPDLPLLKDVQRLKTELGG
jgi:class 3 adenylate cyclase/tetratricopeptide (TPR) repeat protein/tRNA A-37 threonylcarbamoyl transferase component Bud32